MALNSAPTEGVPVVPLSQIKATFPVLKNPANRNKAIRYDFEQWNYAFTNTCPEDYARRLYERYAVPSPGHILFETAPGQPPRPATAGTYVDYHNDDRAPLLFVSGTEDNIMPPKVQWSNAKHYKSEKDADGERRVRAASRTCCPRRRLGGDRRLRALGVGTAARRG